MRWTTGELEEAVRMRESGKSDEEIAQSLGRTDTAVRVKLNRLGVERKRTHVDPEFPDIPVDDLSMDEMFEVLEKVQAFRLRADPVIKMAEVRIPTDGMPVAFSPTSCWHLGGLYTFHEGFRNKMDELLGIDRFYWGVHGDEYEGFPANWAATVWNNLLPPELQKKLVAKIISHLHHEGKLLYSMWSNHPAFEERATGEDPSKILWRGSAPGVPYFSGKGIVKLQVGGGGKKYQEYILSLAHVFKGHSQWNPNHSQRKQFDRVPQADFVIQGDKHTYAYQEMIAKTEAYDAGLQKNETVHLVQTGTAKSLSDPYTLRGWSRGHFIWPVFVLSGKEHRVHRVGDRAALEWYLQREDF